MKPFAIASIGLLVFIGLFVGNVWAASPLLRVTSPTANQTILGNKVTVSFIVGNIVFGEEGHLHFWLDNSTDEASTAAEIKSSFDHELTDISPGNHSLTIEVVKPNHSSFNPRVKETVYFATTIPKNITTILSPTPQNIPFLINSPNWQIIALIISVILITLGIIIKIMSSVPFTWKE